MCISGFGGADGIRTHYLLTASQTLSQLSYSPTPKSLAKNSTKLNRLHLPDNLTKHAIITDMLTLFRTYKEIPPAREKEGLWKK